MGRQSGGAPGKSGAFPPRMSRSRTGRGSWLQAVDEIRRALRMAGRGEDRAAVCLENLQPAGDVAGVVSSGLQFETKIGASGQIQTGTWRVAKKPQP